MPTYISERFIVASENSEPEVEIFVNAANEVFFGTAEFDQPNFFFTLKQEEWEALKIFIDSKMA